MDKDFLHFKLGKQYLAKHVSAGTVMRVYCVADDLLVEPVSENISLFDFGNLTDFDYVELPDAEELFTLLKNIEEGKDG